MDLSQKNFENRLNANTQSFQQNVINSIPKQPAQPYESHNQDKANKIFLIAMVCLILLGLSGTFVFLNNKQLTIFNIPITTTMTPPVPSISTSPSNSVKQQNASIFYQYAATVMGMNVTNASDNPISNFDVLSKYSPFNQWKTYRNQTLGYEIQYPPEFSNAGGIFHGRNMVTFNDRIGVADPQPWDVFNDPKIMAATSAIKELRINGVTVKYGEFIRYSDKKIKDYFFVYQYPIGKDFVHFVFSFVDSTSSTCSSFIDAVKRGIQNAPSGYPGNTICTNDITTKTPDDYTHHFSNEIDIYNQMAITIKVFPKNPNPPPVLGN